MTSKRYIAFVKSDLYRCTGRLSSSLFLRSLLSNVGFKYSFWMRTTAFLSSHKLLLPLRFLSLLIHRHCTYKYGIDIPYNTQIGTGLYIGHFGGIIVNWRSIVGKNCNISPDVVVGQSNRGSKRGFPIIGDNVFLGPGASPAELFLTRVLWLYQPN